MEISHNQDQIKYCSNFQETSQEILGNCQELKVENKVLTPIIIINTIILIIKMNRSCINAVSSCGVCFCS